MGLISSKDDYVDSEHSEYISGFEFQRIINEHTNRSMQDSYRDQQRGQQNQQSRPHSYKANFQNDGRYVKKVISFTEGSENVTSYLRILQELSPMVQCDNLYLPIMCNVEGQETACSDYRRLEMYFYNYDVKLTQQIAARRKYKESFAQPQVWYMLYSILNACQKFESIHQGSGNLKTENILLNSRGHIKIVNKLSHPQQYQAATQSDYSKYKETNNNLRDTRSRSSNCLPQSQAENYPRHFILNSSHERLNSSFRVQKVRRPLHSFYSPEELRVMREDIEKHLNMNIAQTYSIAIIIMEICTFINGERFYEMDHLRIQQSTLRRAEELMRHRYSSLLNNLIKIMLSNAYDRPLPSQIYYAFKPYEKYIFALKPFRFDPDLLRKSLPMSQVSF